MLVAHWQLHHSSLKYLKQATSDIQTEMFGTVKISQFLMYGICIPVMHPVRVRPVIMGQLVMSKAENNSCSVRKGWVIVGQPVVCCIGNSKLGTSNHLYKLTGNVQDWSHGSINKQGISDNGPTRNIQDRNQGPLETCKTKKSWAQQQGRD